MDSQNIIMPEFASPSPLRSVSRETLAKLQIYADLLVKWQGAINLVSSGSLADLWQRHMEDSAQLLAHIPVAAKTVVDLGSGAGFPGLVLAILLAGQDRKMDVHLIESDQRKAAFLGEVARKTGIAVMVHGDRIEDVSGGESGLLGDVITARALAPLAQLLELAARFWGPRTTGLFLKGEDVEKELTKTTKYWNMQSNTIASMTGAGAILKITDLQPKHG